MFRMPVATLFAAGALVLGIGTPAPAQLPIGEQLLVTPAWLAQHQHDPDLAILQVGPPAGYQKEHIAGSRFVSLSSLSTPHVDGALMLEMPPEATLRASLENVGLSDGTRVVVVFDSEWVDLSTRVLFTLGYAGLGTHAALLDGGLAAWKAAGFPVTADTVALRPGHITRHVAPSLIVDYAYVQAHRNAPHTKVIDARDASFYSGAAHRSGAGEMLGGHIPGAVNLPFSTVVDSSNHLLPRATLDAMFRAAGVQAGDTVVAYCHVGQEATLVLLAARVTGHPALLYDGSYQDWSMRKLPTEGGH